MNKNILTGSLILVFFCVGGLAGYLITDLTGEDYGTLLLDFQNLNEKYNNLLEDYNNLEAIYTELQTKYDVLVEDNATLTEAYNELLNDYNLLNMLYTGILGDYNLLITIYNDLVSENSELQNDYDNLVIAYNTLEASYNEMENNYNNLIAAYDTLVVDYEALEIEIALLTGVYNQLLMDHNILAESLIVLQGNFDNLQIDYDLLSIAYDQLTVLYSQLEVEYLLLGIEYNFLSQQWNQLSTWIKGMILPAQYLVFAEAVRRYYFEDYYIQDTWSTGNVSGYWAEFARFCRDIILHDSQYYIGTPYMGYWFPEVSNALADCLRYGYNTEGLAYDTFRDVFNLNWNGEGLFGTDLENIATVVQWCIDEIDYEYDTDITQRQIIYGCDYIKFPVETAFRTKGDCEDQAMLCSAYLESCGFETIIAIFHDAEHPLFSGGFYHGTVLVEIEDSTTFWNLYPFCPLVTFDGGITEWCFIDTTWDVSFGSIPSWMYHYLDTEMTTDDVTFAICDIDGFITL